jgi:glycosyltransferase EpsE
MDTDDIAHPNRLEVLYNFINNNPSYAVVGSRVVEFSERGDRGILSTPGLKEKKSIIRGDGPVHPSVIMNKSLIESVGGYPDYIRAEDFALWSEVLLMGYKIFVLEDVLLHYRVNTVDYSKRRLKYRGGEIRAKLHYFPLLDARFTDYLLIIKSVIAGVVPVRFIEFYRRKKVFKNE